MNKFVTPILIVALLVAGFFWLRAERAAAADAARAEATADSVTHVLTQLDSAYAERDSAAKVFEDSLGVLNRQDTIYRARNRLLQSRSDSILSTLSIQLYADSTLADSTRAAIDNAVDVLQDQIWTCNQTLDNCRSQVSLLSSRLAGDTVLLAQARQNTKDFAELYRQELLKRRKSKVSVGLMGGFGMVYSGGVVYAGPTISIGVTLNLFSF